MNSSLSLARFLGSFFLCVFWVGCASVAPPVACDLPPIPDSRLPERGISAHRGGLFGCPVNTVGAFQRAVCQGVHQIEFDVRATADAAIVVAHDDRVTDGQGKTVIISESKLVDVQELRLEPCTGSETLQQIPTLDEALAVMPQNIWLNIDIKENDPLLARLVAETVKKSNRFHQVIFSARKPSDLAVRRVSRKDERASWISNMSRQIFRGQYVDTTIHSCDEFIQLSFLRGRPGEETMNRLKQAGVRVNYSWLREKKEGHLKKDLKDLYSREVDFVLVDHAKPAMKAACELHIKPLIPKLNGKLPTFCPTIPRCP